MLKKALVDYGTEMLTVVPKDAHLYCSDYSKVDRLQFYVMLMSSLARFESNFKPETTYKEDMVDAKGNQVISRGLFQLSFESANSYGAGLTRPEQLHDVETNIRVAVRIANRWISQDRVIAGGGKGAWRGLARYWSPFRKENRVKSIRENVKKVCG